MSDLAITNTGLRKTASEFHDDFILDGVKYNEFYCPFCEIRLIAKAIYIDGPQGKSPHFSCFPGKPHVYGCNGYPIVNGKTTKSNSIGNKVKIGQDEFQFPEKLVPRSVQIEKKEDKISHKSPVMNPSEIVRRKRSYVGKQVGKAKYTSSLIRSFAKSYKAVISRCYKYSETNKLTTKERTSFIKSILTQMPIELDGYQTNYQTAFQGTRFFSEYPKIWNGHGKVLINDEVLHLKSCQKCEYRIENDVKELDFYISITIPDSLELCPAYYKTIINRLKKAHESNEKVRWFAYGVAKLIADKKVILLSISVLDHVFIQYSNRKNSLRKKSLD